MSVNVNCKKNITILEVKLQARVIKDLNYRVLDKYINALQWHLTSAGYFYVNYNNIGIDIN